MNDNEKEFDLSGEASTGTLGTAAAWLGWALLLALAVVTAVHAIRVTQYYTGLTAAGGDAFAIIRIAGVILAELFAVVTAVLLAIHRLRARQKPAAMAVELTWATFAAVNLISSFAVEHGGDMPAFVSTWVTYGLPIAALVMGIEFYVMVRLNPDAQRADDEAELQERFTRIKHNARLEVMASPQMKAVIRQMTWQQLPPVVGRQLNLTDSQIAALTRQAPQLLDLNSNGVPDIQESPGAAAGDMDLEDLVTYLVEERLRERETAVPPVIVSENGHGQPARPTPRPGHPSADGR